MTEDEHKSLQESRMRLMMSAKAALYQGYSADDWINNVNVIAFAKKTCLDDELEHFASFVWGRLNG